MSITLQQLPGGTSGMELTMPELYVFDEACLYLEEMTGQHVDPYKDARIYPQQQRVLAEYLTEHGGKPGAGIVRFIEDAIVRDAILLAVGD